MIKNLFSDDQRQFVPNTVEILEWHGYILWNKTFILLYLFFWTGYLGAVCSFFLHRFTYDCFKELREPLNSSKGLNTRFRKFFATFMRCETAVTVEKVNCHLSNMYRLSYLPPGWSCLHRPPFILELTMIPILNGATVWAYIWMLAVNNMIFVFR